VVRSDNDARARRRAWGPGVPSDGAGMFCALAWLPSDDGGRRRGGGEGRRPLVVSKLPGSAPLPARFVYRGLGGRRLRAGESPALQRENDDAVFAAPVACRPTEDVSIGLAFKVRLKAGGYKPRRTGASASARRGRFFLDGVAGAGVARVDWTAEAGWQADEADVLAARTDQEAAIRLEPEPGLWADVADVAATVEADAEALWRRERAWTWAAQDTLAAALERVADAETVPAAVRDRAGDWARRIKWCRRGRAGHVVLPTVSLAATGETDLDGVARCKIRRVCPAGCAGEESRRRWRILQAAVGAARRDGYRLQFGTLTLQNAPGGTLAEAVAAGWAAWEKFRRRRVWTRAVVGAVVKMESTWTGSHNLHLHVLVVLRPQAEADFDWGAVQAAWAAATGARWVRWVQVPGDLGDDLKLARALREITKYAAKAVSHVGAGADAADVGGGLTDMPTGALAEWLGVFGEPHRQWWRRYGIWRRLAVEEPPEESAADEKPARRERDIVARFEWDPDAGSVSLILPNNSADPPPDFGRIAAALAAWQARLDRRDARIRAKRERKRREFDRKRRERRGRRPGAGGAARS